MFKVDQRWARYQVELIVRFAVRGGLEEAAIASVDIWMGNGFMGFVHLHNGQKFRVAASGISEVNHAN